MRALKSLAWHNVKLSYDNQAIERGAKALWNRGRAGFWEEAPTSAREHYRIEARAVLEAALAQQAQPLTDEMIEAAIKEHWTSRGSEFREGAKWARDRMAQQAQPDMPTREMIVKALYPLHPDAGQTYDSIMERCGYMADAVLALFAPKETT